MIELRNIHFAYPASKSFVLKGLNWQIEEQAVHGLLGFNGAGKTTLLDLLAHSIRAQEGSVLRDGQPLKRRDIGYLPTLNFFYSHITGREYLTLFNEGKAFDIDAWNKLFSLPLEDDIHSYSTGMKKKLAFLGIIKLDKDILILDEPFNGLDMEAVQLVKDIITLLGKREKTLVITSHLIDPLLTLCNQIHVLKEGAIQKRHLQSAFSGIEEELFSGMREKNAKALDALL
jgi:ABC-2 type transport system ATP-binding protein